MAKPVKSKMPKRADIKPPAKSKAAAKAVAAPTASGKIGAIVALARRTQGASLADLMTATGWQAHSVRGAIAGAIKKKLALKVLSERIDGARVYRIADGR